MEMDAFNKAVATYIDIDFEGYYAEGLVVFPDAVYEHGWLQVGGEIIEPIFEPDQLPVAYQAVRFWNGLQLLNALFDTEGELPIYGYDSNLYDEVIAESYRLSRRYLVEPFLQLYRMPLG